MHVIKKITSIALIAGAAGLSPALFAAEPIKIGVINPFSGPLALYGVEMTRGYELAVDQVNASGGLLGRKVALVRGDAANPQQGIAAVEQLVTNDNVDMFSGTYISAVSNAASDAASRYNKLYWDTGAVAQNLTERGLPNFIRSGTYALSFAAGTVDTVKDLIAPALKKNVKDLKVWIEHEDSIYGTSIAISQKRMLEALGAKIVGVGAHASRSIDMNDTILRAKQANPDVFIETGYVPDGNLLLRTARDQGFKPAAMLYVGTGDTAETLASLGGTSLEGLLVVGWPRNDVIESFGPGAKAFLTAYRAKFKSDPIAPQSMAGYVGLQMLFDTIKAANSIDLEKVRLAAANMDKPLGSYATGFGIKFDKNFQNMRASPTTGQWQSGKMVTVFPEKAVAPGVVLQNLARN
ncbi:ABC transporter substrate-binding protein [Glaciimonas sp. CA11.2]|uniref:ABC transporter substrate-binding protein n=2 Tax=Bacteria TaxID=2 RepID=UPI002AB3D0BD|nr:MULTISPECIES: ABC transporter substrate-binding protein [unclassified Glaciimonas]MDY7546892.1 ABC transporter substrate-binding protein [Glaciimonas sp. CA11.2]MEB0012361.1 ABC transporter substrate-binding protein [Glaciimonas sp. Cout2]MEB0080453.1 ABC transporter substrate-binding protein [Glaciimonas sp. Gout2]MEB0164346.1 ABC transporter substrate-binding protein [Glaciimonas sp. CA11.2]